MPSLDREREEQREREEERKRRGTAGRVVGCPGALVLTEAL